MTTVALVAFDNFSDIDLAVPLDILNRVKAFGWRVMVVGTAATHRSARGLWVQTDAPLEAAAAADVVLIVGGGGSRACIQSPAFLDKLALQPERQLIGAQCSGALILQALGLLNGLSATTTSFAMNELSATGVATVQRPLVVHGNVATAGGCLSAIHLTAWVLQRTIGAAEARRVFLEVTPVGENEPFMTMIESALTGFPAAAALTGALVGAPPVDLS